MTALRSESVEDYPLLEWLVNKKSPSLQKDLKKISMC